MAEKEPNGQHDDHVDAQAREQTGQTQVRLRIDERELSTAYTNMFRTVAGADEVILDFGLNTSGLAAPNAEQPEVTFKVNDRIIMNYYTAKRLAMTLAQVVRRHEEQFGELELDVSKRARSGN